MLIRPVRIGDFDQLMALVSQSGFLTTTAYKIFQGKKFREQWVISVSSLPESRLIAIISYNEHQGP